MLAFADVLHLFAHELARLSAGGFAFAPIAARPFQCSFLRHVLSLQRRPVWGFRATS